jgi:hypothetical protein
MTVEPNKVKHRSYTLFNLVGLAFGICICIVIFLVTDYKLSSDRFDNHGRVYDIAGTVQTSSGQSGFLNTPASDVASLKTRYK